MHNESSKIKFFYIFKDFLSLVYSYSFWKKYSFINLNKHTKKTKKKKKINKYSLAKNNKKFYLFIKTTNIFVVVVALAKTITKT